MAVIVCRGEIPGISRFIPHDQYSILSTQFAVKNENNSKLKRQISKPGGFVKFE
jgi:hypothetical protein